MVKFIQANLNHCRVAQDLFLRYMEEEDIDVAILSDPYRIQDNGCDCIADAGTQKAAILVLGEGWWLSGV